jgi:hypothetical protein
MAKVLTSAANIGGDYTGTVTVSGAVLLGQNTSSGDANIPVVVTGNKTSASSIAPYSFVGGQLAKAESSLAFVWSGSEYVDGDSTQAQYSEENPYTGAARVRDGKGTFSINPNGNLDGMFIGSKSLKAHMEELSGFVADALSSSSSLNNIVHLGDAETITGAKTFTSSIAVGSSDNKVVIDNSSIHINSSSGGGLFFHFNGSSTPTASLKETDSGTLAFGSKLSVSGETTFNSTKNTFSGITLSNAATADFKNGNLYVATQNANSNSSLAASTEYVDNAVSNIQSGAIFGSSGFYTGHNTFANTISLASLKYGTEDEKVDVDFKNGNLYVADQLGTDSSSMAANTKFVKDIVASLSASLRGNKSAIGSSIVPIYLAGTSSLNASLVQSTANVGGNVNPIFMLGGSLVGSSATVGGLNIPVYLSSGAITECNNVVNTSLNQEISGRKIFSSSLTMLRSSPKVYASAAKGASASYGSSAYVDFALATVPTSDYSVQNMRIGNVGTAVKSEGDYTESFLSVYSNNTSNTSNTSIGVRITNDGRGKYAFAPTPTANDGTVMNVTDTNSTVVPTIGWANSYYARKDGAVFTGSLVASNGFKVITKSRSYGISLFNQNESRGGYIGLNDSNELEVLPCKISEYNSNISTASSIRLGYASIGSSIQPIFLDGGRLSSFMATVGSSTRPVYLSSGRITESADVVHINYDETITGTKDFRGLLVDCSQRSIPSGMNPLVYTDFTKGNPISGASILKIGMGFVDSKKTADDKNLFGKIVQSVDANGSSISMVSYKNEANSLTSSNIGVFISSSGTTSYGFAPTPPDSTTTTENRIATTGWCNSYFVRKTVDGGATFNSSLNANGGIYMSDGNGNSAKIVQNGGLLEINGAEGGDSQKIKLGNSTIGNSSTPIYLNSGILTKCENYGRVVGTTTLTIYNGGNSSLDVRVIPYTNIPSSLQFIFTNRVTSTSWYNASLKKNGNDTWHGSIAYVKEILLPYTDAAIFGFYTQNQFVGCTINLLAY